jgi:hypothetical protein
MILRILFCASLIFQVTAKDLKLQENPFDYDVKRDFWQSMQWAWQGSYKQFQSTQNKVFAGIAAVATAYFIVNDDRLSQKTVEKKTNEKLVSTISDSSIFFNTPVLPVLFYSWGVSSRDEKMVRFSKEYLAALTLGLLESAAISMVPVHQRPDQKELSFWEKAFRGQSSFPSGHVIGFSVLGFKAFQFYGPVMAITPFALAAVTGFERVHAEKHYMSDVVASFFISLLASEGVRCASGYDKNHPIYDWIFHHNFSLNFLRHETGTPGLGVSFTF